MEGGCVYLENNIPILSMYKEIDKNSLIFDKLIFFIGGS